MKKILFITILSLSFVFTSCNKDDNNDSDNPNVKLTKENIQGVWNYYAYQGINDSELIVQEHNCETKKDYLNLLEDGSSTWTFFSTSCGDGTTYSLQDWSIDGEIFNWDLDGGPMEYEVLELTRTKFKIRGIDYPVIYVFER